MARKQETNRGKKRGSAKKPSGQSTGKTRTPQRDPWTPWGKWLKARRERRERRQREREERRAAKRHARQQRWMRRRRLTARGFVFIGLIVFACGLGGIVIAALGRPYPWQVIADVEAILRLPRTLSERQSRWESLAVDHYSVSLEYMDDQGTWCGPGRIEVEGGEIVDTPSPGDTHWFPAGACNAMVQALVFENAYGWLEDQLPTYVPRVNTIHMTFDPEFGYPTYAERRVYGEEMPGCCWRVTWEDMRSLYDEEP